MTTLANLEKYAAALRRWYAARRNNDPLVHEPTPGEFDLNDSDWAVIHIRNLMDRQEREATERINRNL